MHFFFFSPSFVLDSSLLFNEYVFSLFFFKSLLFASKTLPCTRQLEKKKTNPHLLKNKQW